MFDTSIYATVYMIEGLTEFRTICVNLRVELTDGKK